MPIVMRMCVLLSCLLANLVMAGPTLAVAPCMGDQKAAHYSMYLVPRLVDTELFRDWAPFLERLGRESHVCFELQIPASIPSFEKALLSGTPDFAYMNPFHLVMVGKSPGYVPLVRDDKEKLTGLLVVRKDSPIRQLSQLQGATVAFPAPNAYAASLLIRSSLDKLHIDIEPLYVGSHSNVFRAVALGQATAGGAASIALEQEPVALRAVLRVLYTTRTYKAPPFAASQRVPEVVRQRVTGVFLHLMADESGRALLRAIQIPTPVRADYDRDYGELEQLGLMSLVRQD